MTNDEDIDQKAAAEEASKILWALRSSGLDSMPAHLREAYVAKKGAERERSNSRRAAKAKRLQAIFERLLSGNTQREIARALGMSERGVSDALKPIWTFPAPGQDSRYIVVRITRKRFEALDRLAADMLLERSRVLEKILATALDDDAHATRRDLHVKRSSAA